MTGDRKVLVFMYMQVYAIQKKNVTWVYHVERDMYD